MDEDGKMPEQKFSGVEFKKCPTDYHNWGCPVFIVKAPMQRGMAGIPKWEPMSRTGVYIVHYSFHT